MKTNDKIERLLDMIEHPEHYSEEEMQKISSLDLGYQGTAVKHFDPEFVKMCNIRKIHE